MRKKIGKWVLRIAPVILIVGAFLFSPTWTYSNPSYENGVYELRDVIINQIKMRVMIRGSSPANPVVLFVSDGFDSNLSYIRSHEEVLEQYVTMVHFDMRGTGRTNLGEWGTDHTYFSMLVSDVQQLTTYLQREFGVDKIILAGHGSGSIVAMQAVQTQPESYQAYIGISPIGDVAHRSNAVIQKLNSENADTALIEKLQFRIAETGGWIDDSMINEFKPSSLLWNQTISNWQSFLFGSETNGWDFIQAKQKATSLGALFHESLIAKERKIPYDIAIPVYFVSGRYDYIVPIEASKAYYEELKGNNITWVEFSSSAHFPHIEEPGEFINLMRDIVETTQSSTEIPPNNE